MTRTGIGASRSRPRRAGAGARRGSVARALLALMVLALAAAPSARARPSRWENVLAPADSLALAGRPDRAVAYADSLLDLARARGDRALEAVVASRRVLNWIGTGRFDEGAREAERVAAIARSVRDTLSWGRALLAAGRAQLFRERLAEAAPPYRELLPLARAARDAMLEGNARLGLAYLDLSAHRPARAEAGYRRAVALLVRARDVRSEMAARVGLARVLRERGRLDEARRAYEAILDRSRASGDRMSEADAWNNLGELEVAQGEPGRAAENFARAAQISRELGRPNPNEVRNLAIMLVEAGRVEAAADTLEHELARWPRSAERETYPLRTQLAIVKRLLGLRTESERILREQWARRDSVALDPAIRAGGQLAELLANSDRLADAYALALEMDRLSAGRVSPTTEVPRVLGLCELELRTGRVAESLARLRRLRASPVFAASGGWGLAIEYDLLLSRGCFAAGQSDSAIAAARRAGEAWERTAAGLSDAEWYEPIGNRAARIAIQTARVLLDPRRGLTGESRAAQAFDALQRFKSRALEWRGGRRPGAPARLATAADLRLRILGPGEVLLDSYSSSFDSTIVFTVDRGSVRAHWLPMDEAHGSGLRRSIGLLCSKEESAAPYRGPAARRLAADALGPALERIRPARRVFCSLSGMLNAIPLAALPADTSDGEPMLTTRTVVAVPSASWLARSRRAGHATVRRASLVTLARTTDDHDRRLDGVREETRWLRARYGGGGIVHDGDRPLAAVVPWLSRGDILHVASHARSSSSDPWGSAFLLGRGDDARAWLTARAIAAHRASARLAVLASCRTTLDGGFMNESVTGLARAFHSAGVPTVIATMWPVDDRATVAFTRRFYLGLEQGRNAAEALREAQLAVRSTPATSAPHFWAGFVLSGDPETRVVPARRR